MKKKRMNLQKCSSSEDEERTDTYFEQEEDPFKEHLAQSKHFDRWEELRKTKENRTKNKQNKGQTSQKTPLAPKPKEDPMVEKLKLERMQELEERKLIAKK